MKIYLPLFFLLLVGTKCIIAQNIEENPLDFPILKGPYFGGEVPDMFSEVFIDEVISKENEPEMCGVFTDEGTKFYYNALHNGVWTIFETKLVDRQWLRPKPIDFSNGYTDRDFTISPDGNKLYFGSNRPKPQENGKSNNLDIYVSEKLASGKWSEPKNMGNIINSNRTENYPSVDLKGNLYFFSCRDEGNGGCEIYISRFVSGTYQTPELLSNAINSDKHDWDSFVAPDGSYIIFSSQNREDTVGMQDLYISYKNNNGNWTNAINMGPRINSTNDEICPSVSLNGDYLFFTSRRRGKADIYWISAKIIETLKPEYLK
ncbi:TolB family protein [Flagellimonas nanhaiensis]|uniref:Exo-alpha-sialidase n=1 Tax=Flagellimonas nanhaiensis TaxID=2292706 RepID=A0A371JV68_9FLAO|nr:PD40 domain-containing protein [Allomuricauda nanhaiensis]RDY61715.1 hypothetical protein DX873_06085 [Allomuricauda nanhaiensis]